jgi:DNA-binding beta-propeller fold protein YncE
MPKQAALPALFFCALSFGALSASASAQSPYLVVAQKADAKIGIIDVQSGKLVGSVPEGGFTVHEVAVSPDGRLAYAPIYGDAGVGRPGTDGTKMDVIDIAAQKPVGTVDFGRGVRPHMPVFGRDGMLYVTTELDQSISVIDPKSLKIVGAIPTGQKESHMLVLSHDGKRGYTSNVGPGTVSVLDIPGRKTLSIIPVSGGDQRISITSDDKWVFTSDTTQHRLAAINTATSKVEHWIPIEGQGYGTAATHDNKYLLVTIMHGDKMNVVDLSTWKVTRSIDVPNDPEEVIVRPDGKFAYVSCPASHQIAEVDLTTWKVARTFNDGPNSDGIAWAGK